MESDSEQANDLSNPTVVGLYRKSAEIANNAVRKVIAAIKPKANVLDLCNIGVKAILDALAKTHNKSEKGIAFPTCISINNAASHFCPLKDDKAVALKQGDVVKIELGAQIDGFAALTAFTTVVTDETLKEVTDKRADVIAACFTACDAAKRMVRPGTKNTDITKMIDLVANEYGVQAVQGVLSHNMEQYIIDGDFVIIEHPAEDMKVDEFTIEENQVFTIDVMMSTGKGELTPLSSKPTVYKRSIDNQYYLKLSSSRYLFNEINKKAPTFPFALRTICDDEKKAKLGLNEMTQHDLVDNYPVLYEKEGEFVARFMTTVLCTKNQTAPLSEFPLPASVKCSKTVANEEIKAALALSTKKKKAPKKSEEKKPEEKQ